MYVNMGLDMHLKRRFKQITGMCVKAEKKKKLWKCLQVLNYVSFKDLQAQQFN